MKTIAERRSERVKGAILDPSHTALDMEIEPGLKVRDLSTFDECQRAMLMLTDTINKIGSQLKDAEMQRLRTGVPTNKEWRASAQRAIVWKKQVRHAVAIHARTMRPPPADRRDAYKQAIIDTFHDELGADEFHRILAIAKKRNPELFPAQEGNGHE
jgi:hypothetical protein